MSENPYASPIASGPGEPANAAPAAASPKMALLVVFLTVFIDLLGFAMVIPLLPIFSQNLIANHGLWEQRGWIIGSIMASFSLMQLIFSPIWGRLSDRFGRRPILICSLGGSACFYSLFGLSMLTESLTLLYLTRIGAGIAAATIPTASAYIADVTTRENRARGMALIGAAFGLGFTCGPLIGAVALVWSGRAALALPGFIAATLSLLAMLLAIRKLPETLAPGRPVEPYRHLDMRAMRDALATPSIGWLLLAGFLSILALANLESSLSVTIDLLLGHNPTRHAAPLPPAQAMQMAVKHGWQILLVFIYVGVVQSIVQGVIVRRVARHVREAQLALFGGMTAVVGFIFLSLVSGRSEGPASTAMWIWAMTAVAVEITGLGFVLPAVSSLISRRTDPAKQGGILGVNESASTLARLLAQATCYPLFFWRAGSQFWMATVVMVAATGLALLAASRGRDWSGEKAENAP